jgi:hypothetical protein
MENIDQLLDSVGMKEASVAFCLATGGMVQMPSIHEQLLERFGVSRLERPEHGDRIIASGAAWIAHDDLAISLAKPIEVLHADMSYVPLLQEGIFLPKEGRSIEEKWKFYCVDPRDGHAKFELARPKVPNRNQASDPRQIYNTLTIKVDETARPLRERLDLRLVIDHDLIATVTASSSLRNDPVGLSKPGTIFSPLGWLGLLRRTTTPATRNESLRDRTHLSMQTLDDHDRFLISRYHFG